MTAISKTANKANFETGDRPTQTDFGNLIDSYTDYNELLTNIGTSAAAGSTGVIKVTSASGASFLPTGAFGENMLAVTTTAAATALLGLGTIGDMLKSTYDPANISQQLVGLTASQTLSNKTLSTGSSLDTNVTGVTQSVGDNSTKIATTAYADRVGAGTWASYTPTLIGQTNGLAFTNITTTGQYRTEGKQVRILIKSAVTGAPGTGTGYFVWSLPPGITVDTTAILGGGIQQNVCGTLLVFDTSTGTNRVGVTGYSSISAAIVAFSEASTTPASATVPITLASGDYVNLEVTLPIT